jgi:hypothetical protein
MIYFFTAGCFPRCSKWNLCHLNQTVQLFPVTSERRKTKSFTFSTDFGVDHVISALFPDAAMMPP